MGEHAKYKGQEIKIGTCEDMYYLRADQVHTIEPIMHSVNPQLKSHAENLRFRFPFPQEDEILPGRFEDFQYALGVSGVDSVIPSGDDHHSTIQFSANYPKVGLLVSLPCPESDAGKKSAHKMHYNGYSGKVKIAQQRLVNDKLVLICQCGSCGCAFRLPTTESAEPIIESMLNAAKQANDSGDCRANFYREIAKRIIDGYTKPNYWTK